MRLRVLLLPLLATLGCHAGLIDARADQDIDMARWRANRDLVAASCADGSVFGPNCGLVSVFTATDDFRAKFKASKCAGLDDAACEAMLSRSRDAWIRARYFAADWGPAQQACDESCELAALRSHDANVSAGTAEEESAINERRAAEHADDAAATMQTVSEVASIAGAVIDVSSSGSESQPSGRRHVIVPNRASSAKGRETGRPR